MLEYAVCINRKYNTGCRVGCQMLSTSHGHKPASLYISNLYCCHVSILGLWVYLVLYTHFLCTANKITKFCSNSSLCDTFII